MPLRIEVKNVGPVEHGRVDIRPLTVFTGANNTGKSYVATIIYALLTAGASWPPAFSFPRQFALDADEHPWEALLQFLESGEPSSTEVTPEVLQLARGYLRSALERYARLARHEIQRVFSSALPDISRHEVRRSGQRAPASSIALTHESPSWSVRFTGLHRNLRTRLDLPEDDELREQLLLARKRVRGRNQHSARQVRRAAAHPRANVAGELIREFTRLCMRELSEQIYYLPASRSGILQSHRALASFAVSNASMAGIEDIQIPAFSGVVADFISSIILMEPRGRRQPPFANIARTIERNILHGEIRVDHAPPSYPEISYTVEGSKDSFPLHRTSSMVSELAPIVLYIQYYLDPGETLILEEPEAHLHPESQRAFARALAQLVQAGASLILTTHSDYFLAELNLAIRRSGIAHEAKRSEDPVIDATSVAAYLFEPSSKGTRIESLQVSSDEGIPDDEFARVADALHNETVSVIRDQS